MEPAVIVLISIASALLLLFALYLIIIAPGRGRGVREFSKVKFAHRGLHDGTRVENSASAFRAAVEAGFGIELDVRLSSDGVLVVHHDDELGRVAKGEGRVDAYTADELSRIKLGDSDDTVPTFDEVLSIVDGRVPLLVEIKEDAGKYAVSTTAAERLKSYKGAYIIESFNPLSVGNARKRLSDIPCGFLSSRFSKDKRFKGIMYFLLEHLLANRFCSPDFIAYDIRNGDPLSLRILRRLFGTVSFAWTVRSEEEEKLAYKRGFDSVIFEGYLPEK